MAKQPEVSPGLCFLGGGALGCDFSVGQGVGQQSRAAVAVVFWVVSGPNPHTEEAVEFLTQLLRSHLSSASATAAAPQPCLPLCHRRNLTCLVSLEGLAQAIPLPDLGSRAQWAPQPDVAVKGKGCPLTGDVGRTKAGGESMRAGGKPRLLPGPHSSFGTAGFPWPDLQLVLYLSAQGA